MISDIILIIENVNCDVNQMAERALLRLREKLQGFLLFILYAPNFTFPIEIIIFLIFILHNL